MGRYGSSFINEGRMAMSVEKLVEHFSALEDPRCAGKVDHRLIDILVIAVCAVIACAESTSRSTVATRWVGCDPF
jgi:DDE_Tnp_1-associated